MAWTMDKVEMKRTRVFPSLDTEQCEAADGEVVMVACVFACTTSDHPMTFSELPL